MKKLKFIIFIILISTSQFAYSQTIRSVTSLESSTGIAQFIYLDNTYFEQSLLWRKRYNNDHREKDSYIFHSLYFRDSIMGVKYFGYEFNLLHEAFDDNRTLNLFRKWNIIRLGGALSIERNLWHSPVPDEYFEYMNANFYIRYYHISKSSRGDRTTKHRRGDYGFFVEGDYKERIYADMHYKPFPYTIIHLRYKRNAHKEERAGIFFEFELNEHGYDKTQVESTKDLYNGITIILGTEHNLTQNYTTLNLGFNMDFRNH